VGSDWPHPSEQNGTLRDDALLFDLPAVRAPEETPRKRILVDNPENLYGFAKSA
jgi:predicted TIM-barrel fold metal-dependent hydrolase